MLHIGTSGWQYRDWRGPFYPPGVPQRLWLEEYAGRFPTVEVNNAFYRLPEKDTFTGWAARTPDGFVFAVKMSRYLTHILRLRRPAEPVERFLDRAGALGPKLGPVLLQLPPTLQADSVALAEVLSRFPRPVRVAVEPRHPTWWTPAVRDVLAEHDAALCWADRGGRPITPLWRTASFGYVRFHEGTASPRPRYGRGALKSWLARIEDAFPEAADVYAYFNNDPTAAAPIDAEALTKLATHATLPPQPWP